MMRNINSKLGPPWGFELKIGAPVIPVVENIHTNFEVSTYVCFPGMSPYGTDRRDGRTRRIMRPIRMAHNSPTTKRRNGAWAYAHDAELWGSDTEKANNAWWATRRQLEAAGSMTDASDVHTRRFHFPCFAAMNFRHNELSSQSSWSRNSRTEKLASYSHVS